MNDQLNLSMSESLMELGKLIQLMDEDANNLNASQAISDYIVPILESITAEIEANRQYILQTADRTNLAYLMNEKTFTGEILTSIADHFSTVLEELPQDTDPESKLGTALGEIQDLLATWMSFDISDEDDDDDSDGISDDDDDDDDNDDDGDSSDDNDDDNDDNADESAEVEVVDAELIVGEDQ
jgi:hypothetical protein